MKRRVVVAGWGQVTQRKEQADRLLDPLGLMAEAARRAAGGPLGSVDGVLVVQPMSRSYPSAAEQLAHEVGASPRLAAVSPIGGNSPQTLVNRAAGRIARGELDSVVIAGAETYYRRGGGPAAEGNRLFQGLADGAGGDDRVGATDAEARHGVSLPIHGFPLLETALWAESGLDRAAYLRGVGDRWAGFSRVAAAHPHAWTRVPLTSEEIVTPSAANRMIAFPYTKFLNPLVAVDMGAAVVLASEEAAARFRVRGRRPVYVLAGGEAVDRQRFLIERSSFTRSPALAAAAGKALRRCRLEVEEVECFDLYSCFPCSVAIAAKRLGLAESDPRPLTLTGGLGFFGGPGNNYSLHAIATLCDAIGRGERDNGMVTALGWFLHKHAAGLYGAVPRDADLGAHDREDQASPRVGDAPVPWVEEAAGRGTIETYTVVYARDGTPEYGVIYGRLEQGARFVARTPDASDVFAELTNRNQVGRPVRLRADAAAGRNVADLL